MTPKGTLKNKVSARIKQSKACVFLRKDFEDMGTYRQIGRILKQLVDEGTLIKLGYGIYARSKQSSIRNGSIPEKPLQELAKEAMQKLGIETFPSAAEAAYNQGRTTQVPTGRVIGVKTRVTRKIGYGGQSISFEILL